MCVYYAYKRVLVLLLLHYSSFHHAIMDSSQDPLSGCFAESVKAAYERFVQRRLPYLRYALMPILVLLSSWTLYAGC
jgi:hypothetical protein